MKLCRSNEDYQVAGVCGGMAEYLGWSSGRLRVVWVLMTIFTAFSGGLIYVGLWYLMPKASPPPKNFDPAVLQPWEKTA